MSTLGTGLEWGSCVLGKWLTAPKTFDDDCWGMERNLERLLTILSVRNPAIAEVNGNRLGDSPIGIWHWHLRHREPRA